MRKAWAHIVTSNIESTRRSYENCFKDLDEEYDQILRSFLAKKISSQITVYDNFIAFFIQSRSNVLMTEQEFIIFDTTQANLEYMGEGEVIDLKEMKKNWYYVKTKEATY